MIEVRINGLSYGKEDLLATRQTSPSFEHPTLNFLRQWLGEQKRFEMLTSGSTGTPKSIQLQRQQLIESAQLTIQTLQLKRGMNALLCLDPKYIAGKMMIVRCAEGEMNIVAVDPSANPFEKISNDLQIDFAAFVPYQIQSILNSEHHVRFNELKCAIIGGAPLDKTIRDQLLSYPCTFYETYGMTETVSHIALRKITSDASSPFETLPGITIQTDKRGCLIIEAAHILNQKVITNDIVEIVNPSKFHWIGRWDNIINSGGVKISPEKVEEKIKKILERKGITSRFFVAGVPHSQLGETVVLVLENSNININELNEWLRSLDRYERPTEIYFTPNFVMTDTGKIHRKETLKEILSRHLPQ